MYKKFILDFLEYYVNINCDLDHLTSFALLLDGANNGGGCDSDFDYILTWISLGLVGFCVVMCCIAVGINELKYQQLAYRKRNTLAEITEIRS